MSYETKWLLGLLAAGLVLATFAVLVSRSTATPRQYRIDDLRAMEDPTKHVCYPVALGAEANEKKRMLDIVIAACKKWNVPDEHELNLACDSMLNSPWGQDSPIPAYEDGH